MKWPLLLLPLLAVACRERVKAGDDPFADKVATYTPQIEKRLGVKFKTPPKLEVQSREQVREFLLAKLNEPRIQTQLANEEATYKLLGMIPDTMHLADFFVKVLTEQIIGYYDPKTKVLYVVKDAPEVYAGITIMHELIHALQDQYVNLDSLQHIEGDDDRAVAVQAIIEGQATFEQIYLMAGGSGNIAVQLPGGWESMRATIREAQATQPVFSSAPIAIQESLLFPYVNGADFVRRFRAHKPNRLPFDSMPVSTEQLMHDSAYFSATPDVPSEITLPKVSGAVTENNFGEFGARLFVYGQTRDQDTSIRASNGWDGDRYVLVKTPAGNAIAWVTVWETPVDAAEFMSAIDAVMVKRFFIRPRVTGERRRFDAPKRTIEVDGREIGGRHVVLYTDVPGWIAKHHRFLIDQGCAEVTLPAPREPLPPPPRPVPHPALRGPIPPSAARGPGAPGAMQVMQDDTTRQAALDAMKRRATLLLVAAAILFVITRALESRYSWLGIVRATMEAAMVGGIADWFAVTALFRHPLGIPIPHTAIVPAKKDRVGRTLGAFVQRNFLSREVIEHRLRSMQVGRRLAEWLAAPENARTISRTAANAMSSAAQMLRDEDVQAVIDRSLAERVRSMHMAPLLGKMLAVMTEDDRHQEVLDEVLQFASRTVNENADLIRQRIERESPWWVPSAIDDKIFKKVLGGIQRLLGELSADRNHQLRERFDVSLHKFIERLNTSPEFAAKVDAWKEEFLDNEAARKFSASIWGDAKEALAKFASDPESAAPNAVENALTAFGQKALEDPELLAKMDEFAVDVAVFLVARYQDEVAELIATTVAAWDPELTSRRVELAIGRDLQFIRINGTLVGGLAGALIYLISSMFP